jgi:hypothetical protein
VPGPGAYDLPAVRASSAAVFGTEESRPLDAAGRECRHHPGPADYNIPPPPGPPGHVFGTEPQRPRTSSSDGPGPVRRCLLMQRLGGT